MNREGLIGNDVCIFLSFLLGSTLRPYLCFVFLVLLPSDILVTLCFMWATLHPFWSKAGMK